jgi:hypothetical protein
MIIFGIQGSMNFSPTTDLIAPGKRLPEAALALITWTSVELAGAFQL